MSVAVVAMMIPVGIITTETATDARRVTFFLWTERKCRCVPLVYAITTTVYSTSEPVLCDLSCEKLPIINSLPTAGGSVRRQTISHSTI